MFSVSICPTFLCNFRCSFCYLTHAQLKNKEYVPLPVIDDKLYDISKSYNITHIDLYGGEVGLLDEKYLLELINIIKKYYNDKINVVSNLSVINPIFYNENIDLSVSWDYNCREKYELVLDNILKIDKDIHILMLASRDMLNWDDETLDLVINIFNNIQNIKTVEIKPYSSNQSNSLNITNKDFEDFIIKWITKYPPYEQNFKNINYTNIVKSLSGNKNSWSDDHIYIIPPASYAVLDFDDNGNEYFNKINNIQEYKKWCDNEKHKIYENVFCNNCKYLGTCLSEHLKNNIKDIENSCDGFYNLLNYYDITNI